MMGEHMMYKHSEQVIEASGRAGDTAYKQRVRDAIANLQASNLRQPEQ